MQRVSTRVRRVAALLAFVVLLAAPSAFADDPASTDTQSPSVIQQLIDLLVLAGRIGVPPG